jgi:hypothetical protein
MLNVIKLSVTYKPFVPGVVMLSVVMLSFGMLNVVMLNVVAPKLEYMSLAGLYSLV